MAGPFDLTGQNIENTYQRILQTPDGVNVYDGTGSLFTVTAVAAPAGPFQSIQFNDNGTTSGSGNFTFNKTNNSASLTGSLIVSDSIYFTGSQAPGRLVWNDVDGTLDLGLKGGNVTLQIGQEQVARVVNKTGANLLESQYKVVRIRRSDEGGTQGQRLAVVLAQGNNDANSVDTLGIVTENIDNNQEGFITTSGLVRNINTTSTGPYGENWADGDVLYLSPTIAGALTNIKPQAPNHTVIMGYVVYAHQNNGKIFVKVDNGYEIDELHNVKINTSSLNTGQLLTYSSSVWVNTNQLTGSYGLTGSLSFTNGGITGSLFGTATTASYYKETDPIFTAKSASLATTGSNIFIGDQTVSGGLFVYNTVTNNNSLDTLNRILISSDGVNGIDWGGRQLIGGSGFETVKWDEYALADSSRNNSVEWESRILYANDGTTAHLDWSNPSYMQLGGTTESPIVNILGIDGGGRIYYTASSAIGGGDFVPSNWTGSATSQFAGTASFVISSSRAISSSFASTSSLAINALTASRLNADSTSIFGSGNRMTITASNGLIINAGNPGVDLQSKITVTGNILPGGTITNNTSSYSLGSPTTAWKDLYVSNGSVYFISGSNTASISFTNGNIDFGGTNVTIPSGSIVPTASFALSASSVNTASFAISTSFAISASHLNNGVSFAGPGNIITGSVAISSSYSLYVPANTFAVGDIIKIQGVFTKPVSATSTQYYIYVNTSNQLSGATQMANYNSSTTRWTPITRTFGIESSTRTTGYAAATSHYSDDIAIATGFATSSLNINWGVDQYILFAAQNATLADRTDTLRFYAKSI